MIAKLVVDCSAPELDRAHFDAAELERFVQSTGIRRTLRSFETATQMAVRAGIRCVRGTDAEKVVGVIVVTQSAELKSPAIAIEVARACGIPNTVPMFDVNQSCSGFVYGLFLASLIHRSRPDKKNRVLLVCVDKLRTVTRGIESLIFSDGACAALVVDDGAPFAFHSDDSGKKSLYSNEMGVHMRGGSVFDFVTTNVPGLIRGFALQNNLKPDFLCQHQPNLSMMKIVDKRAGFEEDQSLRSIGTFGNMSMVSIPATLGFNEHNIRGKRVLLCGYGAGWSVAMTEFQWSFKSVTEVYL